MSSFPHVLKTWRAARRLSQLDLALEAGVSSRHISFLETGRSRPSADMVARLADALRLPLDARNRLLTQAGFAPRYPRRDWSDDQMAPIRMAVARLLDTHMPYPALALDRRWTILDLNPAAAALFGQLGTTRGDSLLDLMTSDRLPPLVENWPEVAHHAAQRLRTESLDQGGVAELDAAAHHLARAAGGRAHAALPVVPTILRLGETRLALFATLAQFGTPEDLALEDLRVEMYFPMDDASQEALTRLGGIALARDRESG